MVTTPTVLSWLPLSTDVCQILFLTPRQQLQFHYQDKLVLTEKLSLFETVKVCESVVMSWSCPVRHVMCLKLMLSYKWGYNALCYSLCHFTCLLIKKSDENSTILCLILNLWKGMWFHVICITWRQNSNILSHYVIVLLIIIIFPKSIHLFHHLCVNVFIGLSDIYLLFYHPFCKV
jgi:hypothetical protein